MNKESISTMNLSAGAKFCIDTLENAGFEAWVVGGCVRDSILGYAPHDYDIATDAKPNETEAVFSKAGLKTFDVGKKHGTISVLFESSLDECGADTCARPEAFMKDVKAKKETSHHQSEASAHQKQETIEITTYRVEGKYFDSRHPDSVEFVRSIKEDLKRRDFTMNAIAFNPRLGFFDPLGGMKDIKAKVIRCVGDPKKRFKDDALRMLRACRFKSQLGFIIEEQTWAEAVRQKAGILSISSERITSEIDKLLQGEHVLEALISCPDVLEVALPEITACRGFDQQTKYHAFDVWVHIAHVVAHVKNTQLLRWAALCHDIGKPSTFFLDENKQGHFYGHAVQSATLTKNVMSRMCLDKKTKQQVITLVERHNDTLSPEKQNITRTIRLMGGNVWLFRQLLQLKRADSLGHASQYQRETSVYDEIEKSLDDLLADGYVFNVRELEISGKDLLALGMDEGPRIKEKLGVALEWVQTGVCNNKKDELIAQMEKHLTRNLNPL